MLALSSVWRAAWPRRGSRGEAFASGSDFDLDRLVTLCRWCHAQTDAPYERGRLVVTALGAGQFTFEVVARAGQALPRQDSSVCPRGQKFSPSTMTMPRPRSGECDFPRPGGRKPVRSGDVQIGPCDGPSDGWLGRLHRHRWHVGDVPEAAGRHAVRGPHSSRCSFNRRGARAWTGVAPHSR